MSLTSFLFTGAALLATGVTATTAESGYSRYGGYNGGYSGSNYGGHGSSSGYGDYGSSSNYGGPGSSSGYGDYGSSSNYGGHGSSSGYGDYGSSSNYGSYGSKSNYGGHGSSSGYGDYGSSSNYGGYGSSSRYGGYGSKSNYGGYGSSSGYGGYSSGRYGRRYNSDSYDSDSWRDSYGHDSYGSDSYGHDSYGKDSYGHDSYGHDSYGKDSYGSDSYGQDSYGGDDYGDDGGHKGAAIYKNDEAPKADGDYSVGNWLICEEVGIFTFEGAPDQLVRLEANDNVLVELPIQATTEYQVVNVTVTGFEISQITSITEYTKSYGPQPAYALELITTTDCDDYTNTKGSKCPDVGGENGRTVIRYRMEGVASFIDNNIDFYNSYVEVWDGNQWENALPAPRELDTITCAKKGKGIACDFKFRQNIRLSFFSGLVSDNELMYISSGYYVQDLKECPNYDY